MRAQKRKRLVRAITGALLSLAAALFAPARAHAACGDYVILTPTNAPPGQAHSALPEAPLAQGELPRPCHGPGCSRAPILPPLAPVAPVTSVGQESACLLVPLVLAPTTHAAFRDREVPRATTSLADNIFHPPR